MTVFTIEIMQGYAFLPLTIVIIDRAALIDTRHPQSLWRRGKSVRSIWRRYDALATFIDHSLEGDVVPCLGDNHVPASQGLTIRLAGLTAWIARWSLATPSNLPQPNTMSAAQSSSADGETVMGSTDLSGRSRGFLNLLFLIYSDTLKGKVPWLLGDIS